MSWYIQVLKKYAVFSGRACRMEFWMFSLINFTIAFVINFVEELTGAPGVLSTLYFLAVLIPSIAVGVRRLHDIGLTGWMLIGIFIPIIGPIMLFFWFVSGSQKGTNKYGPSPVFVEEHEAESEPELSEAELSEAELRERKLAKMMERQKLGLD
jgi:uncharacterized membrane protein YhaH (DUF805 family)